MSTNTTTKNKGYTLKLLDPTAGALGPRLEDANGNGLVAGSTTTIRKNYGDGKAKLVLSMSPEDASYINITNVTSGDVQWSEDNGTWSISVDFNAPVESEKVEFTIAASVMSGEPKVASNDDGWKYVGPTEGNDGWYDWTLDPYFKLKRTDLSAPPSV